MKQHQIDCVGPIKIERLATIPTWTSSDIGRMIFDTTNDKLYIGGLTAWKEIPLT